MAKSQGPEVRGDTVDLGDRGKDRGLAEQEKNIGSEDQGRPGGKEEDGFQF